MERALDGFDDKSNCGRLKTHIEFLQHYGCPEIRVSTDLCIRFEKFAPQQSKLMKTEHGLIG